MRLIFLSKQLGVDFYFELWAFHSFELRTGWEVNRRILSVYIHALFVLSLFQVQDNSPGSSAGLEAFFDFIVAIGNTRLVSVEYIRLTGLS